MERVLSLLLDGKCHSGEAISRKLGVTRAMVWKHIARLKEAGCLIEALPGQGYRLVRPPDFMTQPVLEYCLGDGRMIQAYEELDSTNRAAKDWAAQGAPAGSLVTARVQKAGRGRKGRTWQADPEAGIAMSLVLRPGAVPGGVQSITLLTAVAVCLAVEEASGGACQIKWPNDVWMGGKKVCGILTEMVTDLEGEMYLVAGIGINVAQDGFPPEIAGTATSILRETGKRVHRASLVASVCHHMDALIACWSREGFAPIAALYRPRMALVGEWVSMTQGDQSWRVKITGISDHGALEALDEKGEPVSLISGEVTVRRM